MPGERTLILFAYERGQQADVDTWIEGMGLRGGLIHWLELPTVPDGGPLFQVWLDNAMRTGIQGEAKRARVMTLYTDPPALRRTLGFEGRAIHAAVLTREGVVLTVETGPYTDQGAARLRAALQAPDQP